MWRGGTEFESPVGVTVGKEPKREEEGEGIRVPSTCSYCPHTA